jgi:SAM-dependent methyltransferase
VNPLDGIIADVRKLIATRSTDAKPLVVADMGCGEARLARELTAGVRSASKQAAAAAARRERKRARGSVEVHSFDLVADAARHIVAANLADVPLAAASVHVVVFCLSLMGRDWPAFIDEARRILVPRGLLMIAEVGSRFADRARFVALLRRSGFSVRARDVTCGSDFFYRFDCTLRADADSAPLARLTLPASLLKPCIYKRR